MHAEKNSTAAVSKQWNQPLREL